MYYSIYSCGIRCRLCGSCELFESIKNVRNSPSHFSLEFLWLCFHNIYYSFSLVFKRYLWQREMMCLSLAQLSQSLPSLERYTVSTWSHSCLKMTHSHLNHMLNEVQIEFCFVLSRLLSFTSSSWPNWSMLNIPATKLKSLPNWRYRTGSDALYIWVEAHICGLYIKNHYLTSRREPVLLLWRLYMRSFMLTVSLWWVCVEMMINWRMEEEAEEDSLKLLR